MSTRHAERPVPPYRALGAGSLGPLVLTCEHASRRLPVAAPRSPEMARLMTSHWAWDIGGWALTRRLARELAASAIGGAWSRLWIDLNRRVDDPTLLRREAGRIELPWNAGLSAEDVEKRIDRYHAPYHQELDRLIMRRLVRDVRPLVLAVHTFTPRLRGPRRGYDIGVLYTEHRALAHRLGRAIRSSGLTVRYNQPYSGVKGLMYAAERHGSHHRLPCLELEVNQSIVTDETGVARVATAVRPALTAILGNDLG